MREIWTLLAACLSFSSLAVPRILLVPDDYADLQSALDVSLSGDTVLARSGVYAENPTITDQDVTLAGWYIMSGDTSDIGECLIQPGNNSPCIQVSSQSRLNNDQIIGFTLRGNAPPGQGGGIRTNGANVSLMHCVIDSTYSLRGGALNLFEGSFQATSCRFSNVGCRSEGALAYSERNAASFVNCEFGDFFVTQGPVFDYFNIRNGSLHLDGCVVRDVGLNFEFGGAFVNPQDDAETIEILRTEFAHCRFRLFMDHVESATTSLEFSLNRVYDTQFSQYFLSTAEAQDVDNMAITISHNTFESNYETQGIGGRLIQVAGDLARTRLTIDNNLFLRNHFGEVSCLELSSGIPAQLQIFDNFFVENSNHAVFAPPGGIVVMRNVAAEVFHHNVFMNNQGLAVCHFWPQYFPAPVYAQNCYWGDASGPHNAFSNPTAQRDTVDTLVIYEPFESDTNFLREQSAEQPNEPTAFTLGFAYPNPFNCSTSIEFAVTKTEHIRLDVFDILGREVETLVDGKLTLGVHRIMWQAVNRPSGIYLVRLSAEGRSQKPSIQKVVLLK